MELSSTIGVCIWDSQDAIIPMDISSVTIASDVCHYVAFSLSLTSEDCEYYRLILVVNMVNGVSNSNYHHLRTVNSDELILDVIDKCHRKLRDNPLRYSKYSIKNLSWYFKDIRSRPINFDDEEISGSSSDEEDDLPICDLAYIRQAERRGYLFKRSSKDPNLWKRRFCSLTDKFWCINPKRDNLRVMSISLNDDLILHDSTPSFNFENVIVVHGPRRVHYFRANSKDEQQEWLSDFSQQIVLARDNDAIAMAEVMICDAEATAAGKLVRVPGGDVLQSQAGLVALLASDLISSSCWDDDYLKIGVVMDSDSESLNDGSLMQMQQSESAPHLKMQATSNQIVDSNIRASQCRFLAISQCRLDSVSSSFSDPRTDLSLRFRAPARVTSHMLHTNFPGILNSWGFLVAVQKFKSNASMSSGVSPRRVWLEACLIFNQYLSTASTVAGSSGPGALAEEDCDGESLAVDADDSIYPHFGNLVENIRDELSCFVSVRPPAALVELKQPAREDSAALSFDNVVSQAFWSWIDNSFSVLPPPPPPSEDVSEAEVVEVGSCTDRDNKELTPAELHAWLGLMNVNVPAAQQFAEGIYEYSAEGVKVLSSFLFDELSSALTHRLNAGLSFTHFCELLQSSASDSQQTHQLTRVLSLSTSGVLSRQRSNSFLFDVADMDAGE